ncbi:MAG: FGGY-family carbohydrate kinase [Anaerolineales bacterium]|nr:FGGY-family carbohydrate kinase [Anaerolineales bacterium]
MEEKYIIAHDLGTSGTKAALTDLTGRVIASAESRYVVHYSSDGGAEQDTEDWWQALVKTTREMLANANIDAKQVVGMSMDAQMVGTIPVDKHGNALRRALIWLDSRAEKEAEILRERTGLPFITGKAPSSKIYWVKNNEPEIFAKTFKMLDCKDYIQARMTGEFGTDYSCAVALTYFNPFTMAWWPEVLEAMEINEDLLPTAMPSTQVVGKLTPQAAQEMGLIAGIPIVSGGGDVPCAVIGSGAISPGRTHLYLGTSAWIITIAKEFIMDAEGIFSGLGCNPDTFGLGGEMDNAGGCIKWFQTNLINKEDEEAAQKAGMTILKYMDTKAAEINPGADGLIYLPWIWGERAPVDDDNVRGGFVMLGLNHGKWHMMRAILEGVGHHLRWIFDAIEKTGIPQTEANVIGGGAVSSIWLQILADTTGRKLYQVEGPLDACARGAAMTAAVGLGHYKDFNEVEKVIRLTGKEYTPNGDLKSLYDQAYANFRSLYQPISDIGNRRIPLLK